MRFLFIENEKLNGRYFYLNSIYSDRKQGQGYGINNAEN